MYVHHSQYMHFCRYTLLLSILLSIIAAPIQAADKVPPGNIILSDGTMIGIGEQKPIPLSEYGEALRQMMIRNQEQLKKLQPGHSGKNPKFADIPGLDKALKNLRSDTWKIPLTVYRMDPRASLREIADRYVIEVLIPSTWRRSKIKKHLEITVIDKSGGKTNARSETRKYDINSNGSITPAAGDHWLARLRTARSILDAQQRTYVVLPTYWQWNLALEAFLPTYLFAGPFDIKKPVEIVSRIRELSDKINENPQSKGKPFQVVVNTLSDTKSFKTTPYAFTVMAIPNSDKKLVVNNIRTPRLNVFAKTKIPENIMKWQVSVWAPQFIGANGEGGAIKEEDDIANEVIKAFAGNLATKTGSDTIVIILYTPSPKAPDQFMPRFSLYERNQQEHWVRQVKSKK